jgi:uncharacterized protein YcbX
VTARGLEDDRRWMIVDDAGRFVSQREEPRLALVEVGLREGTMHLSAPHARSIAIEAAIARGEPTRVEIWDDGVEALVHPEGSAWLSRWLGGRVRLVYMPDGSRRAVETPYGREGDVVSFADGYPLLLASEASRADLERRAGVPIVMERFRPNVVVSGAEPWAEDGWSALEIGGLSFRAPKPCARCAITTIDPETAAIGKEPLRTLARFRNVGGKVLFGVNLVPDRLGELRVGDRVAPLPLER